MGYLLSMVCIIIYLLTRAKFPVIMYTAGIFGIAGAIELRNHKNN